MRSFLRSFFATIFAIVFLVFVLAGIVGLKGGQKPKIKSGSYLVLDIYGDIPSYSPPDDIMADVLGVETETLQRILDDLEKASIDKRIKGVIIKVSSNNSLGLASIEEIRDAIHKVRNAGKPVYAYSDDLSRSALFLAAACDSIYAPVMNDVFFAGFGSTLEYYKGTLDKLGIRPNIHKIDEYKTAAEPVLRTDMSPAAREMYGWLFGDIWQGEMKALSEDRHIPEDRLVELMERALFTAPEAKEAGLIDDVLYWDELEARLKDKDDDELKTVSQSTYGDIERSKLGLKGKEKIAVVHAQGMIGGRYNRIDPMFGMLMGHETIVAELRKVQDDDDVKAIVFRVDSPGGESLTSDLIGHAVAVAAGSKPIVVSMIDVAASGGYDISYRATKLVADPMTITGSIGSISGKFNMAGLYNKLGVTFDHFTKGPNGLFWAPDLDFTPEQRKLFEENHWAGFNIWLEDVSKKRGIPLEDLKKLAMGRVWTGRQAVDNGLVDELGGLDRAIAVAKDLAGIPEDEKVTIEHYPKKKSLLELITAGQAGKAAVRWVLYRMIRDDVAQSVELLSAPRAQAVKP
jgi:protease-4